MAMSVLQNSVAFLQLQKNSNLKRATNTSEDVFRIFRRTGRRITLIGQQVERERCMYLKDSYTEKNQLYKELSGIFNYKNALQNKKAVDPSVESPVQRPSEHKTAAQKFQKDVKSINVNVLKRCECCRRRAFRKIENDDEEETLDDNFEDDRFCSRENQDLHRKRNNVKPEKKGLKKISQVSKSGQKNGSHKENEDKAAKRKTVQFSRFDDVRMPSNKGAGVQAGFFPPKKINGASPSTSRCKSVNLPTGRVVPTTPYKDSNAQEAKGASMRPETQSTKHEKLKLEGVAWTSHLQNIQKKNATSLTISGLSKAYFGFRKLADKMKKDEELADQEGDLRAKARAGFAEDRRMPTISIRDSKRLPPRRSSVALTMHLNSWTEQDVGV